MPLATLFIGGVLPASLCSLIRKCAGYMKGIMKKRKRKLQALSSGQQILKQCEKEVRESLAAFGLGTRKIRKPQAPSIKLDNGVG